MPFPPESAPTTRDAARRRALLLAFVVPIAAAAAGFTAASRASARPQGAARPAAATVTAAAAAQQTSRGQVRGLATWDENYLYLAFRIDDTDVLGTNKAPLSKPEEDDSVGVYLQLGKDRPKSPDAQTFAMLVSPAGGFTFLEGDPQAKAFKVKPLFSIKYASSIQGTLNRSDDRDQGYTVEMAIPWGGLNLDEDARKNLLKPGAEIGVNVVVRDRENKGFAALADAVKAVGDIDDPSKWARLRLVGSTGGEAPAGGGIFAQQVDSADGKAKPPLIDGVLRIANEWPADTRFPFAGPARAAGAVAAAPQAAPDVSAMDAEAPAIRLDSEALGGMERLLMARYVLNLQGDTRKAIPQSGVIDLQTLQFSLAHDPIAGAGPWLSSDRVGYHKAQLTGMQRSGIDVALVEAGGPDGPNSGYEDKYLLVLVAALREMAVEGIPAPLIAPCIDTTRLAPPGAPKVDLSTDEGRAVVFRAIRRWMAIVPPEFRSRVQLPLAAGGVAAYPMFLSDGEALAGVENAEWAGELRKMFAREFGTAARGTTVLLAGGPGFESAPGIAASVPLYKGGQGRGALPAYVLQPGREAVNGSDLVPRRNAETYLQAWENATSARSVWTVIDSWNDFVRGTEVAPSRQYGPRYSDLTRIFSVQAGNLPERDVRWLAHDAPRRLRPGQVTVTSLTIQNGGRTAISEEQGVVLTYRWFDRAGKFVAEAPLPIRFADALLPTQSRKVTVGLAALGRGADGELKPIPPGRYVVQIDMAKLADPRDTGSKKTYFAEGGDSPLTVPVEVTANALGSFEVLSSTATSLMQAGGSYPVTLQARWTGTETIKAADASLTWQLVSSDGQTTIATGNAPLPSDLEPGAPATLRAVLNLVDGGGTPLPPSFPELPPGAVGTPGGGYRLRWLLTRTQTTDAVPGVFEERVAVYGGDDEARVVGVQGVPESMEADAIQNFRVTVVNRGPARWPKGECYVGYHWYFTDGIEASWRSPVITRINKDVAPGESVTLSVPVKAPSHDGQYILAFDVARGQDPYFSQRPVTRDGDLGLAYLRVTGGRLAFVDLSKHFDVDAISSEANHKDGDMAGNGTTFPAESFPPDRFGLAAVRGPIREAPRAGEKKPRLRPAPPSPAYPSGYYAEYSPTARRISFRYGPNLDGYKNAVACRGQVIEAPRGRYTGLHLAAAATGGSDRNITITLTYKNKATEKVTLKVGDWGRPTSPLSEAAAIRTGKRRTPSGDVAGVAVVRHVVSRVSVSTELVSITLPDEPDVKIFAMTLDN